ncbi:hypothetical protein [Azospirillum sp. TSO35-2]|uniref:hypothetical protein n=1 Tax=Azospirillum sp. TSO35-2 TaxID=716796 RepID=UPI001304DF08|nr:hypothetical protein [Azospirillum sp. TSO35-2]
MFDFDVVTGPTQPPHPHAEDAAAAGPIHSPGPSSATAPAQAASAHSRPEAKVKQPS